MKRVSSFHKRLKELREERKLTKTELAEQVGLPRPTVSHWESGKFVPNAEGVVKLAVFFEVTTDYILGFEE
ncbi:MAG: helix-turn-helix domain-containing protein [Firmicutes bacterium]|nr:helix-turn-helix domain-containing protein [Bacillota bacterium]